MQRDPETTVEAGGPMPTSEERPKPQWVPGRGKNKRCAQKRNDESQTVDLMPAWAWVVPLFWSLLANSERRSPEAKRAKSPTLGRQIYRLRKSKLRNVATAW